jgi:hypothetical protein
MFSLREMFLPDLFEKKISEAMINLQIFTERYYSIFRQK